MKTNLISKSETSHILKLVSDAWKIELPKIKNLNVHFIDNHVQLMIGPDIVILKIDDTYLPFLNQTKTLEKFPNVMVDMGAIKFMCSGANVMRPGIKKYTEFSEGDIVCIIEESKWYFNSDMYYYTIRSNRFLHHMVRMLVGTMLEVSRGKIPIIEFKKMLELKETDYNVYCAPAKGLFLEKIIY